MAEAGGCRARRFQIGLTLAAALLPFATPALAAPPVRNEQLWGEFDVIAPVSRATTVTLQALVRAGEAVPDPALWGVAAIVETKLAPHISLSGGYQFVQVRAAATGLTRDIGVPLVAATYAAKAGTLDYSIRTRFEQVRGTPGDPWRWRNRVLLALPLAGIAPVKRAFVSDEVFYDLTNGRFSRNRLFTGVTVQIRPKLSADVGYVRQDDRTGTIRHINALNIALKLQLG